MEHAANRASMSHEMSTTNRGKIVTHSQRGHRGWPPGNSGVNGANAIEEPDHFIVGSHGEIGINDPDNHYTYDDDPDAGRSDC